MKKTLLVMSALFLFNEANAQKIEKSFFVYDDSTHQELKKFAGNKNVIIDHVSNSGFEIYGAAGLFEELSKMKVLFSELQPVTEEFFSDYPTAETITKKLQSIQTQYPQLVSLIEIGKSVEGRSLMFAKLTAPAKRGLKAPSARPEFKFVANMHGDEIVGRELMIRLVEDLAKNYGSDSRITNILDSFQVYIMPSMNPDGAMKHQRANANGTDLNRSFPDFTTTDNQNTMNRREPEVQAMMKFQAQHHFKLSANFHGGAEVVNYPFDTSADVFPLDNLVKTMSLNYARKIPYFWNSREFEHGITNGYQWYEVDGGMQDWSYHWHGDLQVTIELTKTKWPNYSNVDRYYQENRDSLLGYIEETASF